MRSVVPDVVLEVPSDCAGALLPLGTTVTKLKNRKKKNLFVFTLMFLIYD